MATVDGSAEDIKNRDIFEERVGKVLRSGRRIGRADGRYYKAPYPLETGVRNYPASPSPATPARAAKSTPTAT